MATNNLVYDVADKPSWGKTLVFALQQLLAIMAATIAVPMIVGNGMSTSAALLGAGVGTIVYLLFTKSKSPVFLGSSFAFLGSMFAAFGGAASVSIGYLGLIIGAVFAGLVYVILALVCKYCGTRWISKLMPAVVIGPTVAIIGLSLSGNAVANVFGYSDVGVFAATEGQIDLHVGMCILVGIVTLLAVIITSVFSKPKGFLRLIPFVVGIGIGYVLALVLTGIGYAASNDALKIIDFNIFKNAGWDKFVGGWCPEFTFIKAFGSFSDGSDFSSFGTYLGTLAVAFVPVAFVVFAEHIADHKNLSSIIGKDLLEEPGLHRTLLGDGVGSMAGAFFGGACNTTYGESVGCVAISGNASIRTIWTTAAMAIVLSFFLPFSTLLASIPTPVMGGVCIALYGFIAVSGLKMIQNVDLGENKNLFVVSVILIAGVGGFAMKFVFPNDSYIQITEVACALILGIIVNVIVSFAKDNKAEQNEQEEQK
ncbi:MAG: uracil-xanthine permease [Bacilli bacterium]|nr:uracil-xanthine permease [Bacilli bacterium]